MKTILLSLMLMLACAFQMQAQNDLMKPLSGRKDVTRVMVNASIMQGMEVGSDVFGMASDNIPIDMGSIFKKIKKMYIYTAEADTEGNKLMRTIAGKIAEKHDIEEIMAVQEDDQDVSFFAIKAGSVFNALVMTVFEDNGEAVIIWFEGNFTMQDLQAAGNAT